MKFTRIVIAVKQDQEFRSHAHELSRIAQAFAPYEPVFARGVLGAYPCATLELPGPVGLADIKTLVRAAKDLYPDAHVTLEAKVTCQ